MQCLKQVFYLFFIFVLLMHQPGRWLFSTFQSVHHFESVHVNVLKWSFNFINYNSPEKPIFFSPFPCWKQTKDRLRDSDRLDSLICVYMQATVPWFGEFLESQKCLEILLRLLILYNMPPWKHFGYFLQSLCLMYTAQVCQLLRFHSESQFQVSSHGESARSLTERNHSDATQDVSLFRLKVNASYWFKLLL